MVPCPLNPAHSVLEVRLVYHLQKCPDRPSEIFHCKYSWVHVFRSEAERDLHEPECPSKFTIPATTTTTLQEKQDSDEHEEGGSLQSDPAVHKWLSEDLFHPPRGPASSSSSSSSSS